MDKEQQAVLVYPKLQYLPILVLDEELRLYIRGDERR